MVVDPLAPTHGLPVRLRVPIAAAHVAAVETFVGEIVDTLRGKYGCTHALLVRPHLVGFPQHATAPLWRHRRREEFAARLFPSLQVWVYVDYRRYRAAYERLGMPSLAGGAEHCNRTLAARRLSP